MTRTRHAHGTHTARTRHAHGTYMALTHGTHTAFTSHRPHMVCVSRISSCSGVRVVPELDTPAHTASWAHGIPSIVVTCPARVGADEEGLEHGVDKMALHPLKEQTCVHPQP